MCSDVFQQANGELLCLLFFIEVPQDLEDKKLEEKLQGMMLHKTEQKQIEVLVCVCVCVLVEQWIAYSSPKGEDVVVGITCCL